MTGGCSVARGCSRMTDQAHRLRRLAELAGRSTLALAAGSTGDGREDNIDRERVCPDAARMKGTRVLAITSGAGGVERPTQPNLGPLCPGRNASHDRRCDLGLANIDVPLGLYLRKPWSSRIRHKSQRSWWTACGVIIPRPVGPRRWNQPSTLLDLASLDLQSTCC